MTDLTSGTVTEDQASKDEEERREFERSFESRTEMAVVADPEQRLQLPDFMVAVLALVAWFILFCGGGLISTERYRNAIGGVAPLDFAETAKAWYVVIAFWLVTNIGLLACVSAMMGAVGRRVGFTTVVEPEGEVVRQSAQKRVGLYYSCAIIRGFGVYSLFLAGLFVFGGDTAVSPKQSEYLQFASLLSIAGFYAGYDPVLFSGLLSRAKKIMNALPI